MVGSRIAALRQAAGLSQQGLAGRLGTHQASVAAWETGRAIPTPIFFRGLVRELGCTLDQIFLGAAAPR